MNFIILQSNILAGNKNKNSFDPNRQQCFAISRSMSQSCMQESLTVGPEAYPFHSVLVFLQYTLNWNISTYSYIEKPWFDNLLDYRI